MNKKIEGNNIIVEGLESFDLVQTLECGQCFRFDKIGEGEYIIIAFNRLLRIRQEEERLIFYDTTSDAFENIWRAYFDLDRNYVEIKAAIVQNEKSVLGKNTALVDAMKEMWGIRIINQDFFEVLISFIISQNKQIAHIKQIVEILSIKYGKSLGSFRGKEYYSFPSLEILANVSEQEFRLCKTGFRAPYLVNACAALKEGKILEEHIRQLDDAQVIKQLMSIKGVGNKVANCVMLFGLGRRAAFPIDVWVKRIMEALYFGKETKPEIIRELADRMYGEYGGYAQQYLFYYGKQKAAEL